MIKLTQETFAGLSERQWPGLVSRLDRMFGRVYDRSDLIPFTVREFVDATSAAQSKYLPDGTANPDKDYEFTKTDSSANAVTIYPFGTQTINGAVSYVLSKQYDTVTLSWCSAIQRWIASVQVGKVAITGGTIDNTTIGATTPSTGAFTTLSASSTVSGAGFSTYLASPPAIGGTVAAAGSFTTLSATGTITNAGGGASVLQFSGAGTNGQYFQWQNTGAQFVIGIQNSVGSGPILGASDNYASVLGTQNATALYLIANNAIAAKLSTGGFDLVVGKFTTLGGATFHTTSTALTDGAGAGAGTIANAPAAGNPTKWIGIDDNGTVRYIPAW